MKLININAEAFDDFIKGNPKSHYLQTSGWGEVAKTRNYIPHMLALIDDNSVIQATALLLEKKVLCYSTFYCPRGFVADFNNHAIVKEMLKHLKMYVKEHHGLYLRMDPDIILHKLNENGEIIEDIPEAHEILDLLISEGGKHRGFTIRFNEASLPRFTFRVSLEGTEEDIQARMHPKTRKVFKNGNYFKVQVYKGDMNSVLEFHETMRETARRKHLMLEPLEYFTNYYGILNKHNMSDIYVAKVNIQDLKNYYNSEIKILEDELETYAGNNSKKARGKTNDLNARLTKMNKELAEVNKIDEEEIILSSVLTAKFDDKVWLIHGGNKDILQFLNANYWLYYQIMMDAKAEGYKVVDFFGTEGKIDKNSDLYGIYLFKCRFGGDFDEFIGEFDYVVRPFMNKIIGTALVARRKLKLKLAIFKATHSN